MGTPMGKYRVKGDYRVVMPVWKKRILKREARFVTH